MEIIYRPSKKKLLHNIFIYSILIACGLFILIKSDYIATTYYARSLGLFGAQTSLQILGILIITGHCFLIIGTINLFFQNYVLIINEEGFINNTNFTNAGLILWSDVIDIGINKKKYFSRISIYMNKKNKKKYYSKIKNPIIKLNVIIYNKVYGAPFYIETTHLSTSDDELFEILKKHAKL